MGELTSQNLVMEGYMKQVLDSLQGMQSKIDEIQGALVETTSAVAAGQHRAEELTARLAAIESSPRTALKHVTVPPLDAGVGTSAEANPLGSPLTSPSGAAAARPPAQVSGSGSADRRDPTLYRGDAPGILGIQRSTPVTDTDDLMLIAATDTPNVAKKKNTIRLQGTVGKHQMLILIDSGSVASFISTDLAKRLQCSTQNMTARQFTVADGHPVQCTEFVPDFEWGVQGHTFTHSVHVLDLGCYDMILGADWLDEHSPMWVHWRKKIMRFTHNKKRIVLRGVQSSVTVCKKVSVRKLQGLLKKGSVEHIVLVQSCSTNTTVTTPSPTIMSPPHSVDTLAQIATDSMNPTATAMPNQTPPAVQKIIEEFNHLFHEPTTLPPVRAQDHSIPMLPGAQPFKVRPYRYSPQQKDEIERQVYDMLCHGIIRRSSSPFASPVLLVKKKDGSWRFCVDYRQLNNLTVKNKHPLPVIDELLDELAGARYFTKLDLRSGYHQIRLADGEQYKTAFQTHQGLYEFMVMPFGLTNAPATFQHIMNTIFEPLLRKSVLVFVDDILVYSSDLDSHLSHLRQVFQLLAQNELLIKKSKCSFALKELEYLGHIIGPAGVSTDQTKVQAVQDWPVPVNVKSLRGWRSYLQHGEFIIRTDHKSLLHLTDQRLHTSLQHKAFVKLMGLQFKIQYKKGNSNLAADALSRKFNDCAAVSSSMAQPSWLDRLQAGYEDDAQARLLIEELGVSGANDKGFSLRDGVLRFHGRIWTRVATALLQDEGVAEVPELERNIVLMYGAALPAAARNPRSFGLYLVVSLFLRCSAAAASRPERRRPLAAQTRPLPAPRQVDAARPRVRMLLLHLRLLTLSPSFQTQASSTAGTAALPRRCS
ncbi:hypothetical protein QYE76_058637 [Lolium multiflorum]|uniref:Reverse transcriptase domain-containing protein n=1 Tax=Lolium multiflorum TaxID=4521 RepID=A0AAD8WRT3_LOLMU|nr:hypothetical protein QYE76_058637 [Lolium multiflorum]